MKPYVIPLCAGLGAQAAVALIAFTPPVFAVAAAPDFGIQPSDVGLFTAILYLGAMVSAAAGGGMVERFGAIRVTQGCLLLCAVGIALTAVASLSLAALGAILVGAGYGPMTPASSHLLAPVTTDRSRPLIFSAKQTSIPIGAAVAGALIPFLSIRYGWRGAALTVSLLGLVSVLVLQPIRARYDGDRDLHAPLRLRILGPLRAVTADRRLREICIVSLAYSAMQLCFGAFFVVFLVDRLALGLVSAGALLTVAQIAGVAGRLLWGAMAGQVIGVRRMLAILGVVMAAAAAITAAVGPDWPVVAVMALGTVFGATAVGWNGLYLAEIARVASPRETARATGGALFFTFSGMMVGPAVFGALVSATGGYTAAFGAAAVATLAPALMLLRPEPEAAGQET